MTIHFDRIFSSRQAALIVIKKFSFGVGIRGKLQNYCLFSLFLISFYPKQMKAKKKMMKSFQLPRKKSILYRNVKVANSKSILIVYFFCLLHFFFSILNPIMKSNSNSNASFIWNWMRQEKTNGKIITDYQNFWFNLNFFLDASSSIFPVCHLYFLHPAPFILYYVYVFNICSPNKFEIPNLTGKKANNMNFHSFHFSLI